MKEKLERLLLVSQILSLLAVPVIVAFFGWKIQEEVKEKEVRRDFVQMAVNILSSKETESMDGKVLRGWAGRVLQQTSPVPISAEELHVIWNSRYLSSLLTPCRPPEIEKPEWAASALKDSDSLEVKVRALLAERRQRIGYEKQLEAAVSACR